MGQYSFWPVAMETIVLSLPRIIGTSVAPCEDGFFLILSCKYVRDQKNDCIMYIQGIRLRCAWTFGQSKKYV